MRRWPKRLEVQLQVNGLRPRGLSLDDYYVGRARAPRRAVQHLPLLPPADEVLEVPPGHPASPTADRLLRLLDRFVTIYPDHVPPTSLLREFIGGSGFDD